MRYFVPKCNRAPKKKTATKPKSVYLMQAGNSLKIGVSSNPHERVSSVQTGCPDKVRVVFIYATEDNAKEVETMMHIRFAPSRKFGEWFDISILDLAKSLLRGLAGQELLDVEVNAEYKPDAKKRNQRKGVTYKRLRRMKRNWKPSHQI